jgi:hypothetical protein
VVLKGGIILDRDHPPIRLTIRLTILAESIALELASRAGPSLTAVQLSS